MGIKYLFFPNQNFAHSVQLSQIHTGILPEFLLLYLDIEASWLENPAAWK